MPVDIKNSQRQPILLQLNSSNGVSGDTDGVKTWNLETSITTLQNELMVIHLRRAIIPFSFFTLSETLKNNMFYLQETDGSSTNLITITVPDGNYNINSLSDYLYDNIIADTTFGSVYNFVHQPNQNFIKISLASGSATSGTFLFGTKSNTIRRFLGFTEDDVVLAYSGTITSNRVIDMTGGIDGVHVRTNLGTDNCLTDSGRPNEELVIIPINVEPFHLIYYQEESFPFKSTIPGKSIKSIEISLTDRFNNSIDFNNIPFTLFLEIDFQFIDRNMDATSEKNRTSQVTLNNKIKVQKIESELAKRAILNNIKSKRKIEEGKISLVENLQNFHNENIEKK
tara:strand:+ start:199 stop:1218 length:1020 start_codon:yes stop_codon:yes gene_type:complete